MACLNFYPRTFTPNVATVILYGEKTAYSYPHLILSYMKDSLAYRGSILWNTVSFSEHGVSRPKQRELKPRLKTKHYFEDFKLIVMSASTVWHRDDNNFIYI